MLSQSRLAVIMPILSSSTKSTLLTLIVAEQIDKHLWHMEHFRVSPSFLLIVEVGHTLFVFKWLHCLFKSMLLKWGCTSQATCLCYLLDVVFFVHQQFLSKLSCLDSFETFRPRLPQVSNILISKICLRSALQQNLHRADSWAINFDSAPQDHAEHSIIGFFPT